MTLSAGRRLARSLTTRTANRRISGGNVADVGDGVSLHVENECNRVTRRSRAEKRNDDIGSIAYAPTTEGLAEILVVLFQT